MPIETLPAMSCLAAVTYLFPGPTTASHLGTAPAPCAKAAIAYCK